MLEDLIQPLDDVGRKQRKFVLGEMSRCIVVSRNGQHPADRLTGKLQNRDPLDSDGYEMLEAAGRNNKDVYRLRNSIRKRRACRSRSSSPRFLTNWQARQRDRLAAATPEIVPHARILPVAVHKGVDVFQLDARHSSQLL